MITQDKAIQVVDGKVTSNSTLYGLSTDTPKPRRTRSLMEAMESISSVTLKSLMFRFWLSSVASNRLRVLELGRWTPGSCTSTMLLTAAPAGSSGVRDDGH